MDMTSSAVAAGTQASQQGAAAPWCGAPWCGAPWCGAPWSGAPWSGAPWSGAPWSGARRRWAPPLAVATSAVAAAVAVAIRDPFRAGAWPGCPFRALTGWYCPFCGSTRAVWALAHGRPALMAANNALLPLWLALAIAGWLWWVSRDGLRRPRPARWVPSVSRVVVPLIVVGFWVARNLPGLAVLAPHGHP